MNTQTNKRPAARIRSLFKLEEKYRMENKIEPKPSAGPVGIIERLKAATETDAVNGLVNEIKTYANVSVKTQRRFLRVLSTKGIPAAELDIQWLKEAI